MVKNLDNEQNTKDLILKTTIELINSEGFDSITIRRIATLANVNVASINYHFKSKDNLINEALKIITSTFRHAFVILSEDSSNPREQLESFVKKYIKIAFDYPKIMKQVLSHGIFSFPVQQEYISFFKDLGFDKLKEIISRITGEKDDKKLTLKVLQLLGSILFPVVMSPIIGQITNINFLDIDTMYSYIEDQLDNILQSPESK